MKYILTVIGALINRIRGGLFDLPGGKLYFPLYLGLLAYFTEKVDIEGAICTAVAGYIGQQIVGWGAYIGSLTIGAAPGTEAEMIDEIINAANFTIDGKKRYLKNYPRAWGFAGLFLRGLVWSFPVGLAVNSLPVMLCGALMPVCYTIPAVVLYKTDHNRDKTAWNVGEYIWGAVFTAVLIW